MPDQWRNFAPGASAPATWPDGIEQLLGNHASPNLVISRASATQVQVVAGTGGDTRSLAIQGSPRWVTSTISATHPGGAAGTHDVWACCTADSFGSSSGPPPQETDTTTRTYTLKITTSGTPSGSGGEALFRKVAQVVWDGSAITSVRSLLGFGGAPLLADGSSPYGLVREASLLLDGGSSGKVAGTWVLGHGQSGSPFANSYNAVASPWASSNPAVAVFPFDPALYALANRTGRLKLQAWALTALTAPGTGMTVGMYPVTAMDTSNLLTGLTLGTVVTGSTVAFSSGALTSGVKLSDATVDFAPPAAGLYALAVVTSGTLTANTTSLVGASLLEHSV